MAQLYARVFLQILDSSIAEDFTVRHVFEDFLKLAYEGEHGVVDMTRQSLARRLNVPQTVLDEAIAKLEAPDPNSRTPDFEGRRIARLDTNRDWGWRILNWEKFDAIKKRADVAERVRRHREKQKEEQPKPSAQPKSLAKREGKPTVWEMKTAREAKEKLAQELKDRHCIETGLSTEWNDQAARGQHKKLRQEIKQLDQRIASSA